MKEEFELLIRPARVTPDPSFKRYQGIDSKQIKKYARLADVICKALMRWCKASFKGKEKSRYTSLNLLLGMQEDVLFQFGTHVTLSEALIQQKAFGFEGAGYLEAFRQVLENARQSLQQAQQNVLNENMDFTFQCGVGKVGSKLIPIPDQKLYHLLQDLILGAQKIPIDVIVELDKHHMQLPFSFIGNPIPGKTEKTELIGHFSKIDKRSGQCDLIEQESRKVNSASYHRELEQTILNSMILNTIVATEATVSTTTLYGFEVERRIHVNKVKEIQKPFALAK